MNSARSRVVPLGLLVALSLAALPAVAGSRRPEAGAIAKSAPAAELAEGRLPAAGVRSPLVFGGQPGTAKRAPPRGAPKAECYHSGDVNGDGTVSSGDAQLAFWFALAVETPTPGQFCLADCNGDGLISSGDAQSIFLEALGFGTCPHDMPDGEYCESDDECAGGHCESGICCAAGECCEAVGDCGASFSYEPRCDDESTCQGTRAEAACEAFMCLRHVIADDSACGGDIMADDCGPYPSFYCTGEAEQTVQCATSCNTDADCDPDVAYCGGGQCIPIIWVYGIVTGAGIPLADVTVTVGTKRTASAADGGFALLVAPADVTERPDGPVFQVETRLPGYGPGFLNVPYIDGQGEYWVETALQPQLHRVALADNAAGGVTVSFNEGREVRAELDIPTASLPPGVTLVAGKVAYVDPTTRDRLAFPGGDYVARTAPEGTLVTLESLGVMNFELLDNRGLPLTELAGPATLCMRVPAAIDAAVGQSIPLWYYDRAGALWQQEGAGTVEERADGRYLCGTTSHFSWWNYDRPIASQACFKYQLVDEATGGPLAGVTLLAEGVNYTGGASERPCACDPDDLRPPCPANGMASLTVKRSTPTEPAQIRVHTLVGGQIHYLVDDGDGSYSLSTEVGDAAVFTAPQAAGSCHTATSVENCAFLDGGDGVLPLALNNFSPYFHAFYAEANLLPPATGTPVYAFVGDPDGHAVTAAFATTDCGTISDEAFDGYMYVATYTNPEVLTTCRIFLQATDEFGAVGHAWIPIGVFDAEPFGIFGGRLIDPSGGSVAGATVRLSGENPCAGESYDSSVTVTADGSFAFSGVPCCGLCLDGEDFYLDGFSGTFDVGFTRAGIAWSAFDSGSFDCCANSRWAEICPHDIYLPQQWGTLDGAVYLAHGAVDTSVTSADIYIYGQAKDTGLRDMVGTGPIDAGTFVLPVPVLPGYLEVSGDGGTFGRDFLLAHADQALDFDFGPGALGNVLGTVFDPGAVGSTMWLNCDGAVDWDTIVTETGQYQFDDVPVGFCMVFSDALGYLGAGLLDAKMQPLTIDFAGTGAALTGFAYDFTGAPLGGVALTLDHQGAAFNTYYTFTLADGSFAFGDLPTGFGTLYASHLDDAGQTQLLSQDVYLGAHNGSYRYDFLFPASVASCWENGRTPLR